MREELKQETTNLRRSWAQHEYHWLRDYLVAGVEDPRVNLQSILTRHFLIHYIAGTRFDWCMTFEYEFCAAAAWLLNSAGLLADGETRLALRYALQRGADNAEGIEVPQFLSSAFNRLSAEARIPNYLETFLTQENNIGDIWLAPFLNTFADLWAGLLGNINPLTSNQTTDASPSEKTKPGVLEVACGSANDFRFLHSYGIAGLVNYRGFDLSPKNIENARALFPAAEFEVGNVFEINAPDKAFGVCMAHDLFEHLSIPGLSQAIKEVCRVTRDGICVGFFQMDEISEHVVRPVDDYHWNLLSMNRTRRLFEQEGFGAQVIHVDSFLSDFVTGAQTHNPNAYTFVLRPG